MNTQTSKKPSESLLEQAEKLVAAYTRPHRDIVQMSWANIQSQRAAINSIAEIFKNSKLMAYHPPEKFRGPEDFERLSRHSDFKLVMVALSPSHHLLVNSEGTTVASIITYVIPCVIPVEGGEDVHYNQVQISFSCVSDYSKWFIYLAPNEDAKRIEELLGQENKLHQINVLAFLEYVIYMG